MKIEIDGLKELENYLKNIESAAKELENTKEVSFTDLFTDSFLRKHTVFTSFEEFESQEIFTRYPTFEAIPDKEMDEFVSAKTNFSNWNEMLEKAGTEYAARKLGF